MAHSTIQDMQAEIREVLHQNATEERREKMKVIAPGIRGVYGVTNPVVNDLAKKFRSGGFDLVRLLWESRMYEEQLLAVKILGILAKKETATTKNMVMDFSSEIHEWSICDTLGMGVSKAWMKKHRDLIYEVSDELWTSSDPWQRRLSLVFVECFCKHPAEHSFVIPRMERLAGDRDRYVRKGVDWIRRNLIKGGASIA